MQVPTSCFLSKECFLAWLFFVDKQRSDAPQVKLFSMYHYCRFRDAVCHFIFFGKIVRKIPSTAPQDNFFVVLAGREFSILMIFLLQKSALRPQMESNDHL